MSGYDELLKRIRAVNAGVEIRAAGPTDAAAYNALMNSHYQRKREERFFQWQFLDSAIPVRLFVAYDGDQLVGCYGMQVHQLSAGARCGFGVDLLVHPEYRNRGLFVLLEGAVTGHAQEQGCVAASLLPNGFGMKAHVGLPGWRNIGKVRTLGLSPGSQYMPRLDEVPVTEPSLVGFNKSPSFRRWRYDEHPVYSYQYHRLDETTFAVTKIFVDPATGQRYIDIVDYECPPNGDARLLELFEFTLTSLAGDTVSNVTTWALPHTSAFHVLQRLGFSATSQERNFCVRVLNPSFDFLYDFTAWRLVQADSEIY